MSFETVLIIYFNLCAVALTGWRTTRRRGAVSYGWHIVSLCAAVTFAFLLAVGGLCLLLVGLTWHGC